MTLHFLAFSFSVVCPRKPKKEEGVSGDTGREMQLSLLRKFFPQTPSFRLGVRQQVMKTLLNKSGSVCRATLRLFSNSDEYLAESKGT